MTARQTKGREIQIFREYWMSEIRLHRRKNVFPDWGIIAERAMWRKTHAYRDSQERKKSKDAEQKRAYRQRPEVKRAHAKRQREKKISDPSFRARRNLSRRLNEIMANSGDQKAGRSILRFVGCSQDELRAHIERQFTKRMTWANYGTYWHVDHILPCNSFDHADSQQVAKCWHWSNLRPLQATENCAKCAKITEPQMALALPFH